MKFSIKPILWISIACCAISFLSCNYIKNVYLLIRGNVAQTNFMEVIPFSLKKGLIIVKGTINQSKDSSTFIFDTGAFENKLFREVYVANKLKQKAFKIKSDSQGNEKEIEMTLAESINLGPISFCNTAAGVLDNYDNSTIHCLVSGGIIGANLIRESCWKIDFDRGLLTTSSTIETLLPQNLDSASVLPFTHPMLSKTPRFELQVGTKSIGNILLDLGSNGGLDLPKSIFNALRHQLNESIEYEINELKTGIFGSRLDTIIHATATLHFGALSLENQPISFSSYSTPKIGTQILKNFHVYLNNNSNEIILNPNNQFNKVRLKRDIGFTPFFESDTTWIVKRLLVNSKAHKNGIQLNSTITKINGLSPIEYYSSYCGFVNWLDEYWNTADSMVITMPNNEFTLRLGPTK